MKQHVDVLVNCLYVTCVDVGKYFLETTFLLKFGIVCQLQWMTLVVFSIRKFMCFIEHVNLFR